MKKTLTKIWNLIGVRPAKRDSRFARDKFSLARNSLFLVSVGILLLGISAFIVPDVLAQDTNIVTIDLEVDSGCTWTGTPYLPTSSLTVYDNDICVITGEGREALNVTVQHDVDSAGQAGGKLIIGGSTTTKTNFTVGGTFLANGTVEIGQTGIGFESVLITNGSLLVSSTGNDGVLNILEDTSGDNFVDVNNSTMSVGTASTNGTFTNNDDSESTIYALNLYGTFENLSTTGTITIDNATDTTTYFRGGTFNNDGIITATDSSVEFRGTLTGDNSGTINIYTANFVVGDFFGTSDVTFNNSGPINITGSGGFFDDGMFQIMSDSEFTNTGAITAYHFIDFNTASVFDNNSGGSVTTNLTDGVLWMLGDSSSGYPTFNNNTGASVTTFAAWITAVDPSTGPSYTDSTTLNNSGGTFTTASLSLGFEDGGEGFGIPSYGGIVKNAGTLTVSGTGNSVELYSGGKLNNLSGGTVDITSGNLKIGLR